MTAKTAIVARYLWRAIKENIHLIAPTIYRGKDLTNVYSIDEMCRRISKGTFTDLFIGDYFDIEIVEKEAERT